MAKFKTFALRYSASMLASMALFAGVQSITQVCLFAFNQPKMPEEIRKFKKW